VWVIHDFVLSFTAHYIQPTQNQYFFNKKVGEKGVGIKDPNSFILFFCLLFFLLLFAFFLFGPQKKMQHGKN
jgi:hypothetical protein